MNKWHDGRIVLVEGDTIRGKVKYDIPKDIVQLGLPGTKEVGIFSAQQLLQFEILDKEANSFRQFYSLPFDLKNTNYEVPVLFELVIGGALTLLTRERIDYKAYNYGYGRSFSRLETIYDFYFLNDNDQIITFSGKKKDLEFIMNENYQEINRFIRSNNIKLDDKVDMARLTTYYNSLIQKNN